ncbi:MAG: ATP-grasp domain-containing protein [Thaumarchaeota archaeon]|nr:ATP-grasp domain-containing protein [Nitrososphaerota archaeon]
MHEFQRVLVANRGEIAVRIVRALKNLGIESVALYSDADVSTMHVRMADKAFRLPGFFPSETYLDAVKIIEIARKSDCDAIHPGYGFLSEASAFSKLCSENSIKFIGPKPATLEISGDKLACKKVAEAAGVPVIPFSREPIGDAVEASKLASEIGFPVLLKSAFGGGGRGMREAKNPGEVKEAFESSEREARSSFGRFALYIEKKLIKPRHIEIQILASEDSTEFLHLGERECSIQRRYQKLVEISPSPVVDGETRRKVSSLAKKVAKAVRYSNAGTVEFLRDSVGSFYFMEINSRLQVEHPVTESVTGVDLVEAQIQIASGKKLPYKQSEIKLRGCAIECRINAENSFAGFAPTSGTIGFLAIPSGPGIRVDTALETCLEISGYYDSLIAKLIVSGISFDQARRRAIQALDEFSIYGVETTIPFHSAVLKNEQFAEGKFDTDFVNSSGVLNQHSPSIETDEDNFAIGALLFSQKSLHDQKVQKTRGTIPTWSKNRKERFVDAL